MGKVPHTYNDEAIVRSISYSASGGHKASFELDPVQWENIKHAGVGTRYAMVLVPISENGEPDQNKTQKTNAQMAGILCNDSDFQSWAWSEIPVPQTKKTDTLTDIAARQVRHYCGVKSRSELNSGQPAQRWLGLYEAFKRRERI